MPGNNTLALLSDNLMTVTVLVYSLAMLAYAAEFAFGRVQRQAPAAEQEKVLVGAGVASGTGSAEQSPAATTGGDTGGAGGADTPTECPGAAGRIGRVAVALTFLGWVAHLTSIVARGVAAGRLPWGNMYEFTAMLTFAAVTAYLVLLVRQRVRYLGLFVLFPVVLGLGIAVTVLYVPAGPLMPALHSYWLGIHVTAAITGSGIFTVGTAATVLYLTAQRYERRRAADKKVGFSALAERLPSKETLDRVAYRTIAFGFPIWTFALIAGAIWAEAAWGRYWGWDPKETWMLITWVIYAGYLHARATAGWKGTRAAVIALLGFAAFLFNYFGVNMWITGLHSYSGLS